MIKFLVSSDVVTSVLVFADGFCFLGGLALGGTPFAGGAPAVGLGSGVPALASSLEGFYLRAVFLLAAFLDAGAAAFLDAGAAAYLSSAVAAFTLSVFFLAAAFFLFYNPPFFLLLGGGGGGFYLSESIALFILLPTYLV